MTSLLIITRGLPGSGKSTKALAWVADNPARRARTNRDQIRIMLHGSRLGTYEQECLVTAVQRAAVLELLGQGVDVVADDTNLNPETMRNWIDLAGRADAILQLWDFTDVPIEECIRRDRLRPGPACVGESVIRWMHGRYLAPAGTNPQPPAGAS